MKEHCILKQEVKSPINRLDADHRLLPLAETPDDKVKGIPVERVAVDLLIA